MRRKMRHTNEVGFTYEILPREEEQKLEGVLCPLSLPGEFALYNFSTKKTVAWGTREWCSEVLGMLLTPSNPHPLTRR